MALSEGAKTVLINFGGRKGLRLTEVMERCGMSMNEACVALGDLRDKRLLRGDYHWNSVFDIASQSDAAGDAPR